MNREPFDDRLSMELRSLVEDANPPPALRPATGAVVRRLPRPLILMGSVAAAIAVLVALLVSGSSGTPNRQNVASEGGATTTSEAGQLLPVVGAPGSTTVPVSTSVPRHGTTTLPKVVGNPTTTTTPTRTLAGTDYPLGAYIYWQITPGPDGNVWAVSTVDVARITPTGSVTKFPFHPSAQYSGPDGITAGPDGNLWFTENGPGKIGRITPSGQITEYPAAVSFSIAAGSDGALWFASGQGIGRMTTSGTVKTFPTSGHPGSITRGPDGNVWFAEDISKIGRITPGGVVTEYSVEHAPSALTPGPDGNVWFYGSGGVGRITSAGQLKEFDAPDATYAWGSGITAAADGNLWFIDSPGHSAFRVTTAGVVTRFDVRAQDANQFSLAAGPGGSLWMTGSDGALKFSLPAT
ncbi:MAG: hypothetical protein JO248_00085 [Acidimicrobiia bacterium]|nr:hypothetical protein [Acidimicrobiia bacterium]